MKFLVFSFHNEGSHEGCSFSKLAQLTLPSKIDYAAAHGYDFYCNAVANPKGKAIGWEKVQIMLDKMSQYDWMLYVECDAMIMNETIRLENIIDDKYDIMLANCHTWPDYKGVNTGVMLVKCSEWSKNFLNLLNSQEQYFNGNWFEQGAIINAIKIGQYETDQHIKLVHNRLFNSYYHKDTTADNFQ
jgi:hypothetical protein